MIAERFPELALLPIEQKRILLDELCEEIAPAHTPDPKIVSLLEERWRAHEADPSGAITLEEFRRRLSLG